MRSAHVVPETRYAKSGDVHIAYQVVSGSGAVDLVAIPPGVSNIEVLWEQPLAARFLLALASFSRMVLFDKRGSGMSDRSIGHPTLEERMDDTRAVMDAVGMERAAIMGYSHGGPMAMLFAATYPERTVGLVLFGTFVRLLNAPDFRLGRSREELDRFLEGGWVERWGTPETLTLPWYCPSQVGDDRFLRWLNRFERQSATPSDLRAMVRLDCEIDLRSVLGAIRVPTLVIHRTGDRINRVEQARWIAAQIPDAEYLELQGEDHYPFLGDQDAIVAAIERFLTGRTHRPSRERVLATVLFTDLVASTERAVEHGPRWQELLRQHNALIRDELADYSGQEIDTAGDGFFASGFDGPARAIRCGCAIRDAISNLGLGIRVGVHTGECDIVDGKLSGLTVTIGARVAAQAAEGEVLVSGTVKDLVAGSGLEFEPRGPRQLKGLGERPLYAVVRT